MVPIAPTLDTAGFMARSVADVVLLDAIAAGRALRMGAGNLKGVRLGLPPTHYDADVADCVERVFEQALTRLREAGVTIVEAKLPDLAAIADSVIATIRAHEAPRSLSAYLASHDAPVALPSLIEAAGPAIKARLQSFVRTHGAPHVPATAYEDVISNVRPALQSAVRHYLRQHRLDAMVFPTVRITAPPVTQDVFSPAPELELRGRKVAPQLAFGRNVSLGSAAGLPGLAIPAGLSARGLPVGLELDGPSRADEALLRLGLAVEAALDRLPPPCL
jgi:mandelamide amidase